MTVIVGVSEDILCVIDHNFRSSYRGNRMEPRWLPDNCWCV